MERSAVPRRTHIMGASGCGVTTLGRALADARSVPHHDSDDYYWLPTDPPYRHKREIAERLRLMHAMFLPRPSWVLSGSLESWGNPLIGWLDLVVFLRVPTEIRLARLRDREGRRIGKPVGPDDPRHSEAEEFIEWASHYDDGTREGRSLPRHEAWLKSLPCPVLRLDGTLPIAELVRLILAA
jgi:adenylate kinase family enzyme